MKLISGNNRKAFREIMQNSNQQQSESSIVQVTMWQGRFSVSVGRGASLPVQCEVEEMDLVDQDG